MRDEPPTGIALRSRILLGQRERAAKIYRHVPVTLDRVLKQDQTDRVEAVGIAVVVFGPLVTILLLLVKAIRKRMPQREELPPWRRHLDEPPPRGDPAGDREPRRPLTPNRSGAVSLPVALDDDKETTEVVVRRADPRLAGDGDQRLAG